MVHDLREAYGHFLEKLTNSPFKVDFYFDTISPYSWPAFEILCRYKQRLYLFRIHPDPLHLAGSGSTSIPAPDPDPDPDPLRFLPSDPDLLKKELIWIRVAPKLFRAISKIKCFCYLRNAFSKFWR